VREDVKIRRGDALEMRRLEGEEREIAFWACFSKNRLKTDMICLR
jgi:hypothetical protein